MRTRSAMVVVEEEEEEPELGMRVVVVSRRRRPRRSNVARVGGRKRRTSRYDAMRGGWWRSDGNWRVVGEVGEVVVVGVDVMRETRRGWARVGLCEMSGERSSEVRTGGEVRWGMSGTRNCFFLGRGG